MDCLCNRRGLCNRWSCNLENDCRTRLKLFQKIYNLLLTIMEDFRERKSPVERYRWMGWLYTIVGAFIVALLVLMFLDMSNYDNFDNPAPEAAPAVQIASPAITNPSN